MKPSLLVGLASLSQATGIHVNHKRYDNSVPNPRGRAPAYSMSIPVDHFDPSNKDTYDNRYFVNDTYYKKGGPVIFYDFGEVGVSPSLLADYLVENNTISAPMRLAAKTNGLVIGWEHRYYGYSRPVLLNNTTGLPINGRKGYDYLTVEQALQDIAFFANRFNRTDISHSLGSPSTARLGPYDTPWIYMGGSYPGTRAAWARIKHPDIFYASWSSSAPLQTQEDASMYFNPLVRSLPQNCTNDIQAAVAYVDRVLTNGSRTDMEQVKTGIYFATGTSLNFTDPDPPLRLSEFDVTGTLAWATSLRGYYQVYGPNHTTRVTCDFMEAFDVRDYARKLAGNLTTLDRYLLPLRNLGGAPPPDTGVAATNPSNNGSYAFAAVMFGLYQGIGHMERWDMLNLPQGQDFTNTVDGLSWSWQMASQIGLIWGSSPDNTTYFSKFYNVSSVRDLQVKMGFKTLLEGPPKRPDTSKLLAMGGWNLTASNVMFTNGEFDPWRAYSVASQETGSPNRKVVSKIPKCNAIPEGNKVFGLVYAGGVHAEDMHTTRLGAGSTEQPPPLQQGLDLFLKAWDVWLPCFNQSRDDMRNGRGVDGQGNGADGKKNGGCGRGERPILGMLVLAMIATLSVTF